MHGAGVIGLRMGASHAQAYAEHPQVRLVAVCDTDAQQAERVRAQFGAEVAVEDYRQLVARDDIDIVSVATPDYFHAEHCVAALEAGKHVLCEKPLALNLADCRAIVEAADRSGKQCMVGQVGRYTPGFMLARRLVQEGKIGELFFVESEYAHNYSGARGVGDWRVDPRRHPFIGGACHAVDLVRWVAGNVAEVFAYSNHKAMPEWPVDDCTIACLQFESGVIGKVFCSIGCRRPYTMRSVFYGTEGTIICDNTSPEIQLSSTHGPDSPDFTLLPVNLASHNVGQEVAELVAAIDSGRSVDTDAREGARTVATCVAAVESAQTGQPVGVNNEF